MSSPCYERVQMEHNWVQSFRLVCSQMACPQESPRPRQRQWTRTAGNGKAQGKQDPFMLITRAQGHQLQPSLLGWLRVAYHLWLQHPAKKNASKMLKMAAAFANLTCYWDFQFREGYQNL